MYRKTIFLFFVLCLVSWILCPQHLLAYNEEKTDSLGNLNSVYSLHQQHSTFHYDLVKLLALEAGYPADSAELIARYSALVDQINPQPNYPYPDALTKTPLPDTFPTWAQSIAGTERTAPGINQFGENPGVYWHFSLRNPIDTGTTGAMVYASDFPHPVTPAYRGTPNFWRVPFSYYLDSIWTWAITGTGRPGNPNGAPKDVYFFDEISNQYKLVPTGSIVALGLLVHSIGDSYSHEECAVTDTIRSHPTSPVLCNANYHELEIPYDYPTYSYPHIDKSAQAIWRALVAYSTARGYNYVPLWADNNSNGVPDQLEETGDTAHSATFIERWKAPETMDLNADGIIDHFDHTAHRIGLAASEIATGINASLNEPVVTLQVYPNPTSGVLNVFVYGLAEKEAVTLFDIAGKKLLEKETGSDGRLQLNTSNFADGIYFIQVNNLTQKVVVAN